jgi:hypothetical protein
MSNPVADLMKALPGSEFYNTGGGCMAVAMRAGEEGAILITGMFGASGTDNFARGADRSNYVDADLTGFYATYHPDWWSETGGDADPVDVYESEDFDALAGVAWDSPEYPEDEDAYRLDANTRHAAEEVARTADAIRAFVNSL